MRHKQLNAIIGDALQRAGFPCEMEPTGLSATDGRRPDGLTLMPWSHGKCLTWDATCVHRLAGTYSGIATLEGSTAAAEAERRKAAKYAFVKANYTFETVAFETFGGVGPTSWRFLQQLGGKLADATHDKRASIFLRQRLGIAIQRGNAAAILESLSVANT